jgi:hypothetical protein
MLLASRKKLEIRAHIPALNAAENSAQMTGEGDEHRRPGARHGTGGSVDAAGVCPPEVIVG